MYPFDLQKTLFALRHRLASRFRRTYRITWPAMTQTADYRRFVRHYGKGLGALLTRRAIYTILGFMGFIFLMATIYEYQDSLWQTLKAMRTTWTGYGIWGYMSLSFMVMASCFPPLPGFSSFMTLGGIFYGFPYGFAPAFVGGLIGSLGCFELGRFCRRTGWIDIQGWIRKTVEMTGMGDREEASLVEAGVSGHLVTADAVAARVMKKIERAVQRRGYLLLVLLRLAPYPWALSSLLLSQIEGISRLDLLVTSAIALQRCLLYTWIGSELARGSEGQGLISIVLGEGSGIVAAVYIYWVIKRELTSEELPIDLALMSAPSPLVPSNHVAHDTPSSISTAASSTSSLRRASISAGNMKLKPLCSSDTIYESVLVKQDEVTREKQMLLDSHSTKIIRASPSRMLIQHPLAVRA